MCFLLLLFLCCTIVFVVVIVVAVGGGGGGGVGGGGGRGWGVNSGAVVFHAFPVVRNYLSHFCLAGSFGCIVSYSLSLFFSFFLCHSPAVTGAVLVAPRPDST